MPNHRSFPLAALSAAVLVMAVGCGSTDDATSQSSDAFVDSTTQSGSSTTSTSTSSAETTPPTSTTDNSTTAPSPTATSQPTTTTTAASPSTGDVTVAIPPGNFNTGPTDLFVLSISGDLELWSDALTTAAGTRTLVADYPDPFGVVTEGPGPNVIDHVAGEVGGAVVFGDCCEPISGTVLAATDSDAIAPIVGGYSPTLSPTGDLLGAANDYLISQTSTGPDGEGSFRQLNQDPQDAYLNVRDLTWTANATSTPDDDHMVVLAWTERGWWLHDVDRSTLALTPALDLGVPPVGEAPDTEVRFAGHGPDGEVVVAVSNASTTRLRYFDPATLAEVPDLERSLPDSASSVRLEGDGVGLLWADGGSLFYLPAGEFEATRLGTDVLAAWFA